MLLPRSSFLNLMVSNKLSDTFKLRLLHNSNDLHDKVNHNDYTFTLWMHPFKMKSSSLNTYVHHYFLNEIGRFITKRHITLMISWTSISYFLLAGCCLRGKSFWPNFVIFHRELSKVWLFVPATQILSLLDLFVSTSCDWLNINSRDHISCLHFGSFPIIHK